jgi:hypothetical protein
MFRSVHRQDQQADLQARTGTGEAVGHWQARVNGSIIGAMKNVLIFAAIAEAGTGLALLIVPSLVGQLLFGEQLTGVTTVRLSVE